MAYLFTDHPHVTPHHTTPHQDAIVNIRPRTRYPVANAAGIPTWVLGYVFWLAPDRLVDMVLKPIHL